MKKLSVLILIIACAALYASPRSPQWGKVRAAHLKAQPVCQLCGTSKDLQVHHIKPYHLYPQLELADSNLVTVCTSKYYGFNCHLQVAHGGNFKWENPWILEDIAKLKVIASPQYIRDNGTKERDDYLIMINKRVKEFNTNRKPIDVNG